MERALLARHAESDYSVRGLVNGDPSVLVGLTEEGRRQSRTLGKSLAREAVDLCVVTEFARTQETADVALEGRHDVPRLVVPELNDPDYGDFEGAALDDYRAWVAQHDSRVPIPGSSEARLDLVRRYARGFRIVLDRPEASTLCVLHSLPLAYMAAALRGREPAPQMAMVPYAEVLAVRREALLAAWARLDAWCRAPTW